VYSYLCAIQVHNPTALLLDRAISPVWYVVGIVGNSLSACVWMQRRMWSSNSSAVYLAAISIADLVFLLLHILQVQLTHLALTRPPRSASESALATELDGNKEPGNFPGITHTRLKRPFVRDYPDEPVPER